MAVVDLNNLKPQGVLSSYNPSWSDRVKWMIQDAMQGLGASRNYSEGFGERATNIAQMAPVSGNLLSANEGYRGYLTGDWPRAILGAVGAMPLPVPGVSLAEKATARDLETLLKSAAEPVGGRVILPSGGRGILAYHGSPNKFSNFSDEFIDSQFGTAYGPGHYLGKYPQTADYYKSGGMAPYQVVDKLGNELPYSEDLGENMAYSAVANTGSFEKALEAAKNDPRGSQIIPHLERMRDAGYSVRPREAYKYQVTVDQDPETFFNLNAKYKDQPQNVRDAFAELGYKPSKKSESGEDTWMRFVDHVAKNHMPEGMFSDEAEKVAVNLLRDKGVPGTLYSGEPVPGLENPTAMGDEHYVVFDPSHISMLRRNDERMLGITLAEAMPLPVPGVSLAEKIGARDLEKVLAAEAEPIGGAIMNEGKQGILAYHGGRDFEGAFDTGKVIKGGGFGHGGYFATNPDTADIYQELALDNGMNSAKYQVHINRDPGDFFFEGGKFADQPEAVKKFWADSGISTSLSADEFHRQFIRSLPGDRDAQMIEAARRMSAGGIPGVRYVDPNSSEGLANFNYVVFDGNDVNILKRYNPMSPDDLQ